MQILFSTTRKIGTPIFGGTKVELIFYFKKILFQILTSPPFNFSYDKFQ